jgi:hypothetical protein
MAFLDDDDYWSSEKLTAAMAALSSNPHVRLLFSDAWRVSSAGDTFGALQASKGVIGASSVRSQGATGSKIFEAGALALADILAGIIMPSCALVHVEAFDAVEGFPEYEGTEDIDFFYRVTRQFASLYLPEQLVSIQLTEGSASRSSRRTLESSLALYSRLGTYRLSRDDRRVLRRVAAGAKRDLAYVLLTAGCHSDARRLAAEAVSLGLVDAWSLQVLFAALLPRRVYGFLRTSVAGRERKSGELL